ncbi:beta-glucosidase 6 [Rhizopus microsporus ATCC 52813]|uniref:glucan 1,3-beta-glucosidase n=1 Tax=Rhizopus microsporus ATCC 52813 TaxID=1340429 RepID=A0A2G4SY88_RHIZD|nr:beta-glucosidase 6 [Rhizopus microsporus ATCC 52813]PHZ13704.1 beta-glucosidase 6 [Rhizopus microsporus ATCC 52813]
MIGVTARAARRPKPVGDEDHRITSPSSPGYKDPFNDSARPNPFTPPLNQSFDYNGRDRIRGINLGGWLVLEPFITPKIFEQPIPGYEAATPVVDEWTLTERLGPAEAKRQLKEHYETFITENDFKKIADMGFNHVRIPTGHWALQVFPGEPFVPHLSWQYLLKGIQWARKYGLRVMVELHTAPGSQNGWNHSGRQGQVGFLNGTEGQLNAERTIQIVMDMIQFFDRPEWSHVVPIFGVLNEPAMMKIPEDDVKEWYQKSHDTIRKTLGPGKGPLLTYHDGFLPLPRWKGFFGKRFDRTVLETHLYLIFNKDLVAMPRDVQADFPCNFWRRDMNESTLNTGPTMVGEFSVATNDCGKYLNGIGLGARFDGTLDQGDGPATPVCPTCTCKGVDDWKKFTPEYKTFLLKFMQKQMDAYETGIGWFYWTYKTQDHVNPHWDYLLAWEQGFAPKDVNNREYSCGHVVEGQQQ